ncbi:MAG TPA: hypothetical protein PK360_19715 [bacterium]|nr:hypothetical protein [bacterium]
MTFFVSPYGRMSENGDGPCPWAEKEKPKATLEILLAKPGFQETGGPFSLQKSRKNKRFSVKSGPAVPKRGDFVDKPLPAMG